MSKKPHEQASKRSFATAAGKKVRKKFPSLVRFFSQFKICRSCEDENRTISPAKPLKVASQRVTSISLKDFQRVRTIGTGSFGRVFLVIHLETKKPYALKVLNKRRILETRQLPHTINEQKILSSLQHPFMVYLVASFQDPANLYLLMDYVPGGELFSILRRLVVRLIFALLSGSQMRAAGSMWRS